MSIGCVAPYRVKANCVVAVIAAMLIVSSCGGGGGGGSPAVVKKINLSLSWDLPTQRENEQPLSEDDIQACVILYFRESELADSMSVFPEQINSLADFVSNNSQIGYFISGAQLPEIISSGSPHTVLIPSSEISNYTFSNVQSDTYFFSVSCSDWDDLYSELSTTVSIDIP